jgi:hypothetical protein
MMSNLGTEQYEILKISFDQTTYEDEDILMDCKGYVTVYSSYNVLHEGPFQRMVELMSVPGAKLFSLGKLTEVKELRFFHPPPPLGMTGRSTPIGLHQLRSMIREDAESWWNSTVTIKDSPPVKVVPTQAPPMEEPEKEDVRVDVVDKVHPVALYKGTPSAEQAVHKPSRGFVDLSFPYFPKDHTGKALRRSFKRRRKKVRAYTGTR